MKKLITPFGELKIKIDEQRIPYTIQKREKNIRFCPDVLGRFIITVHFIPDGRKHSIACVFVSECSYEAFPESGERLECQSFYNERRFKMSIGLKGDLFNNIARHPDKVDYEYDYDVDYLTNGMAYLIFPETKTKQFVFSVSWIDDVGSNDLRKNRKRDVQTWFGADPHS